MADLAADINYWRYINQTFLSKMQRQLFDQYTTINKLKIQLKTEETAQAKLNGKYLALIGEQKHLQTRFGEVKLELARQQKENEDIKSIQNAALAELERLKKLVSDEVGIADKVTKLDTSSLSTDSTIKGSNEGDELDMPATPEPIAQTDLWELLLNENEKRRSITIQGLKRTTQKDDLMRYFSKFGVVVKVILAERGNSERRALIVFSDSLPKRVYIGDEARRTFGGTSLHKDGTSVHNFLKLAQKLKKSRKSRWKMEFVHYQSKTQPTFTTQSQPAKESAQLFHKDDSSDNSPKCQDAKNKVDTFNCQLCQIERNVNFRIVFSPCCHGACDECAIQLEKCHICSYAIDNKQKQFE